VYSLLAEHEAKWQGADILEAEYTDEALEMYYTKQQNELRDVEVELMTLLSGNEQINTSTETLAPFFEDPLSFCIDLASLSESYRLKLMEMLCKLVGDTMYKEDNHLFHSSRALKRMREEACANVLSTPARFKVCDSPVTTSELMDWPYGLPSAMQNYAQLASVVTGCTSEICTIGRFLGLLNLLCTLLLYCLLAISGLCCAIKHRCAYDQLLPGYCPKQKEN
jgi:hypothetical protein